MSVQKIDTLREVLKKLDRKIEEMHNPVSTFTTDHMEGIRITERLVKDMLEEAYREQMRGE